MKKLGAAVIVFVLTSGASAQPTPSCPGDCNLDGTVTIDELLRGVNFLLAGEAPDGCDELDDDRNGQVVVNEMIRAVLEALNGCRFTGDAAAEATAGAAAGVVDSFQVLDIGSAAAGGAGSSGSAASQFFIADGPGSAAGQAPPCAAGGTVEESCASDAQSSRLAITFSDCRTTSGKRLELIRDGRLVRTVDDGSYCSTRQIADGARVNEELTAFRQAIAVDGEILIDFTGTFMRDFIPDGTSCAGRTGTERYDGSMTLRCAAVGETTACPPEGRDVMLVARGLTLVRSAVPAGSGCARARTLLGRLELRDAISGLAFDAVYRQFVARDITGMTSAPIELQGALALDCLGELSINTEIPLLRAADERCPSNGLLFPRLAGGTEPGLRYLRGAVEIDLDGDGKSDAQAESCEDMSLARCE
jgi:hypothetical protein